MEHARIRTARGRSADGQENPVVLKNLGTARLYLAFGSSLRWKRGVRR
jgi:hypothetical protein